MQVSSSSGVKILTCDSASLFLTPRTERCSVARERESEREGARERARRGKERAPPALCFPFPSSTTVPSKTRYSLCAGCQNRSLASLPHMLACAEMKNHVGYIRIALLFSCSGVSIAEGANVKVFLRVFILVLLYVYIFVTICICVCQYVCDNVCNYLAKLD